jgi:hypothetical protein
MQRKMKGYHEWTMTMTIIQAIDDRATSSRQMLVLGSLRDIY